MFVLQMDSYTSASLSLGPPVKMCMIGDFNVCTLTDFHVNKTDIEFKILMSTKSSILEIKDSSIPKLGEGVCRTLFDSFEPNHLEGLRLSKLGIEEIMPNAFQRCEKLNTLILSDNKIEKLNKRLLNENTELKKIDLSNNLIKELHIETFFGLEHLKELRLTGNHLKTFSADLIKFSGNLEVLLLDSNDLFDLNAKMFSKFAPKLKIVAFNNNQMRCGQVGHIIRIFTQKSFMLVDQRYEEPVRDRIHPTESVESIICLSDIPWAAAHYIYVNTKIMEDNNKN